MSVFAIGDIHGCLTAFEILLAVVPIGADDRLVLLGDYVDRGPNSKGVLDRVLRLQDERHTVALFGNHEQMLLQARDGGSRLTDWLLAGGDATLASYGGGIETIPDAHWNFLENGCLDTYESDRSIFAHAGVYHDLPLADQPEYVLRWQRFDRVVARHESGKTLVCGHTSQKNGLPNDKGFAVCIDTWACGGQWLTCLQTETGRVWQANEAGEVRQFWLDELETLSDRSRWLQ